MKKILVTGENSYIGTSFVTYMEQFKEEYEVETISVRGDEWREKDFSNYDVIFHVVGLAHQKETTDNKEDYFIINTRLTQNIADKAKDSGVKHFIFLSSMSVYGIEEGTIYQNTSLNPTTYYGKSKYQAEQYLKKIESVNFKVAIVRPPMVYGINCKGNYRTLSRFSKLIFFFPKIENERSMIFIDNLLKVVTELIENEFTGLCLPQNIEYVKTYEMIKKIRKIHRKKTIISNKFNIILKPIINKSTKLRKIFGSLRYDKEIIYIPQNIRLIEFDRSIEMTER